MARDKKKEKTTQSSEEMYYQAMHLLEKSQFENGELLKLGVLCYWRAFCSGNKDAAFSLFNFFYACDTKHIPQNLPLAYTFYRICQLIKYPKCQEYKDKIGIEKLVPYLDCAKEAYRNFMMAHERIGSKSVIFEKNFNLSLLYYNNIVLPDGMTLSHAVLSKISTEWDDRLKILEDDIVSHFYVCSIDKLFFNCMTLTDDNDKEGNENTTLMADQDDDNSGCCCIVM